jgi:hypothetical protein
MYTAYIGRRLLDLHNAHEGATRSPRAFFDEVFFPLFFDDERYLMWVNNSPFDQAFKLRSKEPLTSEVRRNRLAQLHAKATAIQEQDGSILLGSAALGVTASTSSQVTDLPIPVSADEVYLSWIGAAAGVGVEGGFSLLIDDDQILQAIMQGWSEYRQLMNTPPGLKPHQIDTWNGWWLTQRLDNRFEPGDLPVDRMTRVKKDSKDLALVTARWSQVVFALARQCHDRAIPAYIYTFGNTNKTIGFIQLHLPRIFALRELYIQLFGTVAEVRERSEIETLYETQFSFLQACRQGSIGLHALEPRKLREYMPTGRGEAKLPKPPTNAETRVTYAIYETWIIAMLSNNERLLEMAQTTAEALQQHASSSSRAKATSRRLVESTLEAGNRRRFIEGLTEILETDGAHAEQFDALVHEIVRMPASDFPLLLTLIKFKYALADQRAKSAV